MAVAKCLIDNKWIEFSFNPGSYVNILDFFNKNDADFISKMYIDFSAIILDLHGNGKSRTLLEYIANNSDNTNLILRFLNYFLFNVLQISYSYGTRSRLDYSILYNIKWQEMNFHIVGNYVPVLQWSDGFMYNDTPLYNAKVWYN
jgi:hypothetical protein